MTTNYAFFATCPRGLEMALAEELHALDGKQISVTGGGAEFSGDCSLVMSVNLHSRIATRILLRLAEGSYRNEDDIYRLAKDVDWHNWFSPDDTFRVYVTAIKSPLKSIEFATLRIKDGVCDRFRNETGERPSVDTRDPDMRIHAFLKDDRCMLYIDTSGAPLYQRGLRQKTVDAPLKENLAAGLLHLARWTPDQPLFDPMCGSGTLLLEAAQIARNMAPGLRRSFAFQQMKCYEADEWNRLLNAAKAAQRDTSTVNIFGADIDPVACRATLANLDRAGLLPTVSLNMESSSILDASPPATSGILISNPPYGVRLSEQEEMAAFYPKLGDTLKKRFANWSCFLLSGDMRLPKLIGLKPSRKTPLFNGDIDCRLFELRIVAGSNRKEKPENHAAEPVTQ